MNKCVYCECQFTKESMAMIEFSTFLENGEIQDNKFCSVSCYDNYNKVKKIIYKIVYDGILDYQNKNKRISGDSNEI